MLAYVVPGVIIGGVALAMLGLVLWLYTRNERKLIIAEIAMMKDHGRFEGEPEYMRKFRVARAVGELGTNSRLSTVGTALMALGLLAAGLAVLAVAF